MQLSFRNVISAAGLILAVFVLFTVFSNTPMVQKAYGQVGIGNTAPVMIISASAKNDPCEAPWASKSSFVVNIGSATTTALASATAGKVVYACSFKATVSGTTPTVVFKTGTQVSGACDTSTASISGTYAITSGTLVELLTPPLNSMQSITGGQICATTGGTGPSVQGLFTYVTMWSTAQPFSTSDVLPCFAVENTNDAPTVNVELDGEFGLGHAIKVLGALFLSLSHRTISQMSGIRQTGRTAPLSRQGLRLQVLSSYGHE
jgi:hypothetical protein